MPWEKVTEMSIKLEFIRFALQETEAFTTLCKRFKISTKTGYKMLNRYRQYGEDGLKEQSRRPHSNPNKTAQHLEDIVVSVRRKKPYWGARKIHAYLNNQNAMPLPAVSTITDILSRNGLIHSRDRPKKAFERFEHQSPNDLWQIDFKGHFAMHRDRCHPLTILDDHSRFSLGIKACQNESTLLVQQHFIDVFEEYGLPYRINFDNGTPWAAIKSNKRYLTELSLWLIRLGIQVSYSRIKRPQTNGKIERFHQTLKKELLQYHYYLDIPAAQKSFDAWRFEYNFERPHEALDLKTPATRYQMSSRLYPERLPDIEYRSTDTVRQVDKSGKISYQNKKIFIGEGLKYLPVGLREKEDGMVSVFFCHQKLVSIDLKAR